MNELFGLSMTYIMIALLVILGIAVSTVGWIVLRNRVMFFIGIRNIPRRRAQTALIVIGLMLSTLIISTAFSIGDTVDYSITNQVFERMHSIDEVVQAQSDKESGQFDAAAMVAARPIPEGQAEQYADAFKTIPGVDGAVGVIRGPVPVTNPRAGQTEPVVVLVGLDPSRMQGFESDIEAKDGQAVSIGALAADEVYANASAAEKLDIRQGDQIQVFTHGEPHVLTVRDIVEDRVLSGTVLGTPRGLVLSLERAQELFERPGEVDLIAVSNDGGVRSGVNGSKQIKIALNEKLQGTSWRAASAKADAVDEAATVASFFTTFFVVLGLFSIAAGMMLIFLIFVMLAAERKMEMGMVRAVGTKRQHLVQMFISEGMAYNTAAAAVGCALGIVVSMVMMRIMAAIFSQFDLAMTFHVTPRSLIVSYSLGVVLTFLTVTFSSWRIGNLNIVSAIRDAADPTPLRTQPDWRGARSLPPYAKWLVFKPGRLSEWLIGLGFVGLAPLFGAATAGLFMAATALYDQSAAASVAAVLLGVAGIVVGGLALVAALMGLNRLFQTGTLAMVIGGALTAVGWISHQGGPFSLGVTLAVLGAALTLVMLRFAQRAVFTTMGLALLLYWLLGAGGHVPPELDGGMEMFFISGFAMVMSGTFVLVYNADIMLGVLVRASSGFSHLVPSIRTAVAYPLANKFRTGMTIAMISLVMFALVMMSTMNSNFSRIFLSDDALGGYDAAVTENPSNPIADLKAALQAAGHDTANIVSVDDVRIANQRVAEVRMAPQAGETGDDFAKYPITGPTDAFIMGNGIKFQARAERLSSDADVWRELRDNPNAAVIDAFSIPSGGFDGGGGGFMLDGVKSKDTVLKGLSVQVRDSSEPGKMRDVEIIGIFSLEASAIYYGLYLSPGAFDATFARPESSVHLVKLQPGTDARAEARGIEKALLSQGVQADSLRKLVKDQQAQSEGFMYLIQGFMGIGLFVGIAAVGVIAFRTVVERRQQIGMLRAIGFTRGAVAMSFIMESSFITLLGIFSGIGLGLLLAQQLVQGDEFGAGGTSGFYIPWLQIAAIGSFAFLASLVMTIIPSRQASSIPIAEALRYE